VEVRLLIFIRRYSYGWNGRITLGEVNTLPSIDGCVIGIGTTGEACCFASQYGLPERALIAPVLVLYLPRGYHAGQYRWGCCRHHWKNHANTCPTPGKNPDVANINTRSKGNCDCIRAIETRGLPANPGAHTGPTRPVSGSHIEMQSNRLACCNQ